MLPDVFTPNFLRQLELLKFRTRKAYLGSRQGGHVSLKRGHGIEFSDYRKYELGDNPRHIDWGVYARSERLYVKRFQEEQDLSVFIIADATSSMITPASDNKWNMARDLSIALSYVALMQHDKVTICVPGAFSSPPYQGARAIHYLSESMQDIEAGNIKDFVGEIRRDIAKIRFPGVAIFISDLLMPFKEIQAIVNLMRAKNLEISIIQVLGPNDLEPLADTNTAVAIDSETGEEIQLDLDDFSREEYKYLLEQHNDRLKQFFAESCIAYSLAQSTQALPDYIVKNLSQSGLLS